MVTDLLDRLAAELSDDGWRTMPRYEHDPAFLRVWHPGLEVFGLSVGVLSGLAAVTEETARWYVVLPHVPLPPCDDVSGAVERIAVLLGSWILTARSLGAAR